MNRRPSRRLPRDRPSPAALPDAYVYLLERGVFRRAPSRARPCPRAAQAERHAWVAAELNGAVYYFDPTWDLQDEGSAEALPDYLSHTWFALTAARMAVRHTPDATGLWPDSRANADNYYVRSGYTAAEATVAAGGLPPCAASGRMGAPCWNSAASRRRSMMRCARCSLTASACGMSTARSEAAPPHRAISVWTTSRSSASSQDNKKTARPSGRAVFRVYFVSLSAFMLR